MEQDLLANFVIRKGAVFLLTLALLVAYRQHFWLSGATFARSFVAGNLGILPLGW